MVTGLEFDGWIHKLILLSCCIAHQYDEALQRQQHKIIYINPDDGDLWNIGSDSIMTRLIAWENFSAFIQYCSFTSYLGVSNFN
jgi:hypothetical protein